MTSNHASNEQQEMAAALRESRALLAEAQRIAHLGTWRRDCANDALEWSDETLRMFDWPAHLPVTYTALSELCASGRCGSAVCCSGRG